MAPARLLCTRRIVTCHVSARRWPPAGGSRHPHTASPRVGHTNRVLHSHPQLSWRLVAMMPMQVITRGTSTSAASAWRSRLPGSFGIHVVRLVEDKRSRPVLDRASAGNPPVSRHRTPKYLPCRTQAAHRTRGENRPRYQRIHHVCREQSKRPGLSASGASHRIRTASSRTTATTRP